MIPTPRCGSNFVVPTQAPIVDWWSTGRKLITPIGVSTRSPSSVLITFSVSVVPAFRIASAIDSIVM